MNHPRTVVPLLAVLLLGSASVLFSPTNRSEWKHETPHHVALLMAPAEIPLNRLSDDELEATLASLRRDLSRIRAARTSGGEVNGPLLPARGGRHRNRGPEVSEAVLALWGDVSWKWDATAGCLQRNPRYAQRLRILCLGDSITYGNGSHTGSKLRREPGGNYPLMLQTDTVLRSFVCPKVRVKVENLGWNGCSAQDGKRVYRSTIPYREALRKVNRADVVVLILGTNDSKDYNWKGPEPFEDALASYVDEIRSVARPDLKLILGTPPPTFPNPMEYKRGVRFDRTAFAIRMARVRNEIRDSVIAVAENENVLLLDLYDEIERNIKGLVAAGMRVEVGDGTTSDVALIKHYYHDGVHPYSPTHEFITAAVRDTIIQALNSSHIEDW